MLNALRCRYKLKYTEVRQPIKSGEYILETVRFNNEAYPKNVQDMASDSAKELIDSEIIEKQKELVREGQKLSIFLSFFITTLVVLFFMAMLVYTFQSLQDDLFEADPFVQVLTLASPILAVLALSIIFNFKRITFPILFRVQKFLFYPVDFAYKVWSEEFRQEFVQKENTYRDVIETQEDTIESLEKKLNAQRLHGRNIEKLLRERISAQGYSEESMRCLLEHLGEYVLFVDPHGVIPDYFSRSILNLIGYEPKGESFSKIANFSHQEHIEFLSFVSHISENHLDFYRLESLVPKLSHYQMASNNTVVVKWRYRPHYGKNGKLKAIIAIGSKDPEQEKGILNVSHNSTLKNHYLIEAEGLDQFAIEIDAKTDYKLKKSFQENVLKQPLKSLIGSLENNIYSFAESLGKEVEFDYYQSMNQKISLKDFERLEPIIKDLSFYLINQHLEMPHRRREVGKLSCGQLHFESEFDQFGSKGSYYQLKIDGQGVCLDQLKTDLLRAGFSLTQNEIDQVDYSVLLNKQLNNFYQDQYIDSDFIIARPIDLSTIKKRIEGYKGSIKIDSQVGLSTTISFYFPKGSK